MPAALFSRLSLAGRLLLTASAALVVAGCLLVVARMPASMIEQANHVELVCSHGHIARPGLDRDLMGRHANRTGEHQRHRQHSARHDLSHAYPLSSMKFDIMIKKRDDFDRLANNLKSMKDIVDIIR